MNMPVTRVASLLLVTVLSACGGSSSPMSNTNPPPTGGNPPPPPTTHTDVLTYKNDNSRTGQNLTETQLTLANVNSSSFGRLRTLATDGKVDAQPLYAASVSVQGASHNVVFVATEHDSVYAFDADSGANLWQVSLLGSAEVPSDTHNCSQVSPMIGITATPVIDRSAGANGTLYVVAMSKTSASPATYFQRLHALDLATGAELLNGPITIAGTYPMTGGTVTFEPNQYEERAALLLSGGTLYLSFTSHCDQPPYSGWVFAYSAATLTRTAVLNVAPNSGGAGPAIWMAGGGPAADAAGNIYLLTANGEFETTLNSSGFPSRGDYGNSFLKLTLSGSTLAVSDYFTMFNEVSESGGDVDLGSGGIMLLPDLNDASGAPRGLAVGAGKDGNLYVVERSAMGHFTAGSNHIWQQLSGVLGAGIWSTPAYFNGTVYYGPRDGALLAFPIASARLAGAPASRTATSFTYPGTAPAISANGTSNGIVWAHENSNPAVLHAYDAGDLMHELYNSSQASGGRDQLGAGNKF
ncbi:MAG TPA: PQQ-binding-like beta-propeller repeat protein, partial [Candidatus Dormibacteraeota bacterium]|nr:PQQ-binding-like beta-propeller repeat protein [Candidatus Dormibacteraeota bacterium]